MLNSLDTMKVIIHSYKNLNNFIHFYKHYMPVSHWVAACFSDPGYAEYFDS